MPIYLNHRTASPLPISLNLLNGLDRHGFVEIIGPVFEHSPWIAERTWPLRPFRSRIALHEALCGTMYAATDDEQVLLIQAHPDLAAWAGTLTPESTREQAALGELSPEEVKLFDTFNQAYHQRFGFPFVICARENRKESILAAFPLRLAHSRVEEIAAALHEISKIAMFRLEYMVADNGARL